MKLLNKQQKIILLNKFYSCHSLAVASAFAKLRSHKQSTHEGKSTRKWCKNILNSVLNYTIYVTNCCSWPKIVTSRSSQPACDSTIAEPKKPRQRMCVELFGGKDAAAAAQTSYICVYKRLDNC